MDVWEQERDWYSDDFKSGFMLALALHIFVVLLAFIAGRLLQNRSHDDALAVLKASVRVDVVGMPKLTLQELRAMEASVEAPKEDAQPAAEVKPTAAEAPPKPDDLVLPSEEKKQVAKSFSNLLADYSTKKVAVEKKPTKGVVGGKVTGLEGLIVEGNRLSKGTALTGDVSDEASSAFTNYVQTLPDRVREHWRLPGFLKDQELKCRVQIWIGPRGELLKTAVRESSGNSEYDARAEQAVKSAAPFVAPPTEIASNLATRGIVLGFPL